MKITCNNCFCVHWTKRRSNALRIRRRRRRTLERRLLSRRPARTAFHTVAPDSNWCRSLWNRWKPINQTDQAIIQQFHRSAYVRLSKKALESAKWSEWCTEKWQSPRRPFRTIWLLWTGKDKEEERWTSCSRPVPVWRGPVPKSPWIDEFRAISSWSDGQKTTEFSLECDQNHYLIDLLIKFFGSRSSIFEIDTIVTIFRNFQNGNTIFRIPGVVAMLPW